MQGQFCSSKVSYLLNVLLQGTPQFRDSAGDFRLVRGAKSFVDQGADSIVRTVQFHIVAYEASLGTFGNPPFIIRAAAMDFARDRR